MMITLKKSRKIILCFSLFICSALSAAQGGYPLLEQKIKMKQYKLAYKQALKLRALNEGDPRFDYLYGLAALETGHFNEAVFALDRVTVASPEVIRPRLELGRAYLKLNNKVAALKHFNDVLVLSPPPIVQKNVFAIIEKLKNSNQKNQKKTLTKLASFSIGYDDNINFGTDNSEIDIPGVGSVKLNSSAIKQKSGFAETKFQFLQKKKNSKTKNTFLMVGLSHREYFKSTSFNFSSIDLRAGLSINRNDKQYQFVVRDRPSFLDGKLYSNTIGLDAVIRKSINPNQVVSTYLSLENYDNKRIPLSDRKRVLIGMKLDFSKKKAQHQFDFQMNKEYADKRKGNPFSRNILGVGYKASYDWNSSNTSYLNLDYRNYKHQAAYSVFPSKREDNRFIIKGMHELKISKKMTLSLSVKRTKNNSNLKLYDVKRNEIEVGMRYEWD